MIFFENERSQVRTLRASFREIARIFAALGVFDLGWHWLKLAKRYEATEKKLLWLRLLCLKIFER